MNKISIENIIKLMSLPNVGRKTVLKLIQEITFTIKTDNELIDFVNEQRSKFRIPDLTKLDYESAFHKANEIILKSHKNRIEIITFQDKLYPPQLRGTPDFPITLNYTGDISTLSSLPCVAIIGTREPTDFGFRIGVRLGEYFGSRGFNIISGLAVGCDTAGHTGALKSGGISTAVLAHGLDTIYPKENKKLASELIEKGGVLVSEYYINQKPHPNYFVERDRIQAGLGLGVIIVETGVKGGTMHTVKFCLDRNRILAAINHPFQYLQESKTQGNQQLIREGKAQGVYNITEIEELLLKLRNQFTHTQSTRTKSIQETETSSILPKRNTQGRKKDHRIQPTLWE